MFKIGDKCNWKGQPERLIYLGDNFSGNGFWHQFALIQSPGDVWCEIKGDQMFMLELTTNESK